MGFFSKLVSAGVKTALTPIALVKDVVDVATGQEPKNTEKIVEGAIKDVEKAIDKIT